MSSLLYNHKVSKCEDADVGMPNGPNHTCKTAWPIIDWLHEPAIEAQEKYSPRGRKPLETDGQDMLITTRSRQNLESRIRFYLFFPAKATLKSRQKMKKIHKNKTKNWK